MCVCHLPRFADSLPDEAMTSKFVVKATVAVWEWAKSTLIATPAKFHYIFSLNDISRVFQGLFRLPKSSVKSPLDLLLVRSGLHRRCRWRCRVF